MIFSHNFDAGLGPPSESLSHMHAATLSRKKKQTNMISGVIT